MKYVALLRGINSGKNPTTKMEVLKKAFEEMGFENVKTVIASGNVIFETNKTSNKFIEDKVEKILPKYIGFQSETIIRTIEEIETLLEQNPFRNSKNSNSRQYVTFIKDSSKELEKPTETGFQIVSSYPGIVCYTIEEGIKTPDVMSLLQKQFGKSITTRNWKTVERIVKAAL